MTDRCTFVLVPGAWLGAWVWKRIIPILEKDGHRCHPVTLTGMGDRVHLASDGIGIETAVEDVLNVIKYNDLENLVLVGHSFAGKIVASVADDIPERVRSLLYLDAFRPRKNLRAPQGALNEEWPTDQSGNNILLTNEILDNIGKDVQGEDRRWLLSKVTPWPTRYATEPVRLTKNFDGVKNSFIFCTGGGDSVYEIIAGKWGKLDGAYKVLESGHWPMITRANELARDMVELSGFLSRS
jgi:pimeloyl-ACP methyl ester carboxylesterase